MRKKDTSDVLLSTVAVIADAVAIIGGFLLATWIRFNSGWVGLIHTDEAPENLYRNYALGACVASLLFILVFRALQLYVRPQLGRFENKIPRIVRAVGIGVILSIVLAYLFENFYMDQKISSATFLLSVATISVAVLLERWILYRIEWNMARHSKKRNKVLILGTDNVAAHLQRALRREAMLRSEVAGFLRTDLSQPDPDIEPDRVKGTVEELTPFLESNDVDQIIVSSPGLDHAKLVDIMLLCERNLIAFNMVPDLFRIMTSSMDVQSLDDIPLLGIRPWPLDRFWNRAVKRAEDITGALVGLILSAPIIAIAAILIKRDSPGPIFYRQERCGEGGESFDLFKLRTMRVGAEEESGPVWAKQNDPRRTHIGTWLRRHSMDELPQFWNVLKGDMSLVGPRPERPHFVDQFKKDIGRYMWRHISKPGITGWAQVNGLRGNTSIEERIKYDLYYLENWSLAFDFKIIIKTSAARDNAY